jgi:hypothetical protein
MFVGAKERLRMMQMNDTGRWLRNKGEYHPEGLSMAYRDDLKHRSPSHIDLDLHRDSRSVYSQDMGMPWRGPETYQK